MSLSAVKFSGAGRDLLTRAGWEKRLQGVLKRYQNGVPIESIRQAGEKELQPLMLGLQAELSQCQTKINQLHKPAMPVRQLRFELFGAGLSTLSAAVRLKTTFPNAAINIVEAREGYFRFQTLSFRMNDITKDVFKGTDLLHRGFKEGGAWDEPAPADGDRRLRAPIACFQNTMTEWLKQRGVTFEIAHKDIQEPNKDPDCIRFIGTGQNPNLEFDSAPWQLDEAQSTIVQAWTFTSKSGPVIPKAFRHEVGYCAINLTGGNKTALLEGLFKGLKAMTLKKGSQVSPPTGKDRSEIEADITNWTSKENVEVVVHSSYTGSQDDLSQRGLDQLWRSTFKMIPYIGLNPFFLAPESGNVIGIGDLVNARHPYKGNGSKAIFEGIKSVMDYLLVYQTLSLDNAEDGLILSLIQQRLILEHLINNIPRLEECLVEHLVFCEKVDRLDEERRTKKVPVESILSKF